MRRITILAIVGPLALIVAACGGSGATNAPAATASSSTQPDPSVPAAACAEAPPGDPAVTVDIKDFAYAPDPIAAKVGDAIAWTNSDSAPHTASLADGSCTTDQLATGSTGALVFSAAGTYTYQCNIHPGQMNNYTINVTE